MEDSSFYTLCYFSFYVSERGKSAGFDIGMNTVVGVIVAAVAAGLLWMCCPCSPCCGRSSGGKTMKAPGRDYRIFRSDFEADPAGYFRDLHGR